MPIKVWRNYIKRRVFAGVLSALSLLALLTFASGGALASGDISALIKKLDRSEWEIVSRAVVKRLPSLIGGDEERAYFNKLLQASQDVAAMAEALEFGDYEGLGAISANIAARDLENMVASRFGEDSRLYRTIQIVKKDPELAEALIRAALNADAYTANRAIRSSLRKFAEKRAAELQQQGEKFWKDMARSVIPGGSRLAGLGFDPVDIYLQGIKDWSDFTARARLRFNKTMLDCLAIRYRKVLDDGYNRGGARLEIENFDTGTGFGGSFNCSLEMDRLEGSGGEKSATQRLVDFFTRSGRSTAAMGELNMTASEIVDLIEQYEDDGGRAKNRRFSNWLQDRLLANIYTRASGLIGTIAQNHKQVAEAQIAEANRLLRAIEVEIGRLERRKDRQNAPAATGGGTGGEDTGGDDIRNAGSAQGTNEDGKVVPPAMPNCNKLTGLLASIGQQLAGGRVEDPYLLMIVELTQVVDEAQEEGACSANIFAEAADLKTRLQSIADLLRRTADVIGRCDIDAIPPLLDEMSRAPAAVLATEISFLQTARTGVSQYQAGRAAYSNDNYKDAKSNLMRALEAFRELPPRACQAYAERARRGLDIIAKIEVEAARVSRAINICDLDDLRKIIATYPDRKNRFFTRALGRVNAALPECEKNDRIIAAGNFCEAARTRFDAARADFLANRLSRAERRLRELIVTLSPAKTEYCAELNPRARTGLANIAGLREQNQRLRQAIAACDFRRLQTMEASFRGKSHPWYALAAARATAAIDTCRPEPPVASKACQEIAGIVSTARDEMAAGRVVVALRGLYAADLAAGENCKELQQQIGNEIAAAEAVEVVLARSESAIATCDTSAFTSVEADLGKISHPSATAALTKLYAAVETCGGDDPEAEDENVITAGRTETPDTGGPGSLNGNWVVNGLVVINAGGERMELPLTFEFSVNGDQVNVPQTNEVVAMRGRVDGDTIRFSGQKTEDGATVGAEAKGTFQEDGTLSGQITLLFPEITCLGEAIGEAIGGAAAGALGVGEDTGPDTTCELARYPGTWSATRR